MLFLCEKAVQSRRIRLSSGLGIEEGRVSTYRRVDFEPLSGVEQERRAVAVHRSILGAELLGVTHPF